MKTITKLTMLPLILLFMMSFCLYTHAEEGAEASAEDVAVDFDVASMSNEEAFQFMKDFVNRTPDELDADEGKIMHIKGQVSRYVKKSEDSEKVSFSIGIKGEGGTIWGVNFYVEGWTEEDYPEHNALAEVTGVWGKVEDYGTNAGRTLICEADDVKAIEP